MCVYKDKHAGPHLISVGINDYADPRPAPPGSAEEDARGVGRAGRTTLLLWAQCNSERPHQSYRNLGQRLQPVKKKAKNTTR